MSSVTLRRVAKRYDDVVAVDWIDLEIREGEFLTLLGPSGCGKTTTLRMIAGFIGPSEGSIHIAGEDVTHQAPQKRRVGMVFQDYALFPHLTVAENIAFGLVERGAARAATDARVRELLQLIRLPDVAHRYPAELSGGQQQRVALARAIAFPPRVLLMDEPLGALDLKMREAMQLEVRRIQQELRITTVYVTHDQTEAMTMSDRIAVMNAGRIEQLDTPAGVYRTPSTRFVAGFVGKVNLLAGRVAQPGPDATAVDTPAGRLLCPARAEIGLGAEVTVAVRPEQMRLLANGAGGSQGNMVQGIVDTITFTGNLLHVIVRLPDASSLIVETRPGGEAWRTGAPVHVAWESADSVLIADSGDLGAS